MKENIDENVVLLLPPMKDADLTKGEDKPFILYKPSDFSNDEEIGCEENHCDHNHPPFQTVHPKYSAVHVVRARAKTKFIPARAINAAGHSLGPRTPDGE